jgi:simple sugar transport system permease protein
MTSNSGPPPDAAPPAPPGSAPPADERVRKVSGITRLLTRPELGAIVGAALVWVFFAIVAYDNSFVSWGTTAAILNRAAPL